jgi:hypothetical protein
MAKRILKLVSSGLTGKDLIMSCFTKRIQPLQHRERLMYYYDGRGDNMCATKENLSSGALDMVLLVTIKIPHEVHSHVCGHDIYTEGADPLVSAFFWLRPYFPFVLANLSKDLSLSSIFLQFKSLEEKDLRFLVRTPTVGTSNPEAASDAKESEVVPPTKRKRETSSSQKSKRLGATSSSKVTKNLEKQRRLKEIDTSSKKGEIE